jgi:hypothetical protein
VTWWQIAILAVACVILAYPAWAAGREAGYRAAYREMGREPPEQGDDGVRAP